jgi:subtilisin family serine protease
LLCAGSVCLASDREAGPARARPGTAEGPEILLRSRRFVPPEDRDTALRALEAGPALRSHVVLQFHSLPDERDRAELERAGVRLLDYLPRNAYLATVPRGLSPTDPALQAVRWIGRLEPEDRISPHLRDTRKLAGPDGWVDLDVRPFADEDAGGLVGRLAAGGFEIVGFTAAGEALRVRARADDLLRVASDDAVRWIGPAPPPFVLHNDQSRSNTGAESVQAGPYFLSGLDIDLGIWDGSGVADHGDFGSRLMRFDPVAGGRDTRHATHVCGTMAGDGALSASEGGSAQQWRGMAPSADIISYDFFGDLVGEIGEAIDRPGDSIEVVQNSWGYGLDPDSCFFLGLYDGLCRDYDNVVRGSQGKPVVVVFSAGNDRYDGLCGDIRYESMVPLGTAKNVITVGGALSDDDSLTNASSWGPTDDGRLKPDVTGPGCGLNAGDHVTSTWTGPAYASLCGTSMAAPAVSGSAALLWEQYRISYGPEPLPSTVKALLIHTAVDLDTGDGTLNPGPDYASGYGRIDVHAAVDRVIGGAVTEQSLKNGQTDIFNVDVAGGDTGVRVTLVWDDPGAAEGAGEALVNDLDLIVDDPDAVRHYPWTLDPANPAAPAVRTAEDHTNNVEQVWVPAPYTAGIWSIRVAGTSVPTGPQAYSLVITPDAGFEPFGPDLPAEGTVFEPNDPAETFTWHAGFNDTFKVEWSNTADFSGKMKKSGKKFTSATTFIPGADLWRKILKLGAASGTVYWRIVGKDAAGDVTHSTVRSFEVTPERAAEFTSPGGDPHFVSRDDPPLTFSWDDEGNSKFKITFSAKSTISKPKKTSGDSWLTRTDWIPTDALWSKILALADKGDGQTVYYQMKSKDLLGRRTYGTIRTLIVNP